MDSWPIALQQLLNADDFDMKYGDVTVRSDMDVGPAKVRARYTDAVDTYTCSILMNKTDFETLTDFYKTTLAGGSLPFLFNDPFTGVPTTFRFTVPPELKPLGGLVFRVSMAWERLP